MLQTVGQLAAPLQRLTASPADLLARQGVVVAERGEGVGERPVVRRTHRVDLEVASAFGTRLLVHIPPQRPGHFVNIAAALVQNANTWKRSVGLERRLRDGGS